MEGQAAVVDSEVNEFDSQQLNFWVPAEKAALEDLDGLLRSISALHVRSEVDLLNALNVELQVWVDERLTGCLFNSQLDVLLHFIKDPMSSVHLA